jgi:hypothetical protein
MSNQNNNNQGISQQFLDYMINLLKTGYSYQQIVSFLQKYNYPVNTINYYYQLASRRVNTQASQQSYQQQFVQQRSSYSNNFQLTQIADYIKNMEARGYTFQQIKSYLASRGYSSNIIDDAAARIPTQNNNLQQSWVKKQSSL